MESGAKSVCTLIHGRTSYILACLPTDPVFLSFPDRTQGVTKSTGSTYLVTQHTTEQGMRVTVIVFRLVTDFSGEVTQIRLHFRLLLNSWEFFFSCHLDCERKFKVCVMIYLLCVWSIVFFFISLLFELEDSFLYFWIPSCVLPDETRL